MKIRFRFFRIAGLSAWLFLLASCASVVATQNVPVSTNPSGAQVLADGKAACVTPCAVDLARNQDHLLTFQKEGFRQQDVAVRRQHQTEMSLLKAINSGVNSASFFNDPAWGLSSAVQSLSAQQATGEAYVLLPSTVAVTLVPDGGFPQKATETEAEQSLKSEKSPLDLMDGTDEHMLETALESSKTGHLTVWTNDVSGYAFAVEPEDGQSVNGFVVRPFRIGARKGGESVAGRFSAYRAGRAEWVVGNPPESAPSSATTDTRPAPDLPGAARALAESPWPSVKKDWKVQESTHGSTTVNPDGSVTTREKESSTKVGVSVNPGAAVLGVLDALKGMENKE